MKTFTMERDEKVLAQEAERLHATLGKTGFRMEDCATPRKVFHGAINALVMITAL
jgi:hypothetical protein